MDGTVNHVVYTRNTFIKTNCCIWLTACLSYMTKKANFTRPLANRNMNKSQCRPSTSIHYALNIRILLQEFASIPYSTLHKSSRSTPLCPCHPQETHSKGIIKAEKETVNRIWPLTSLVNAKQKKVLQYLKHQYNRYTTTLYQLCYFDDTKTTIS